MRRLPRARMIVPHTVRITKSRMGYTFTSSTEVNYGHVFPVSRPRARMRFSVSRPRIRMRDTH